MPEEQKLTAQQIENALQVVADCCARCDRPEGQTMTNWQWSDATRSAAQIVAAVCRTALQNAPAPTTSFDELVEVGTNGEQ